MSRRTAVYPPPPLVPLPSSSSVMMKMAKLTVTFVFVSSTSIIRLVTLSTTGNPAWSWKHRDDLSLYGHALSCSQWLYLKVFITLRGWISVWTQLQREDSLQTWTFSRDVRRRRWSLIFLHSFPAATIFGSQFTITNIECFFTLDLHVKWGSKVWNGEHSGAGVGSFH